MEHDLTDAALAPPWLANALMSPAQSHTIGSPEERLHYRSWPAPVADAPGLLLVHGFGAHSHWWDACAPYLARNFRVVAMDLAGMGDSAHRSCYSQRQFADDMARVIHAAQLAPAILVAHSFGGIMASWFAHYHKSLLQALVLVDARLGFPGDKDDRQLDVAERPDRLYPDYASARARFRLIPEDHVAHPALFEHVARHSLHAVNGGWKWKFDRRIMHMLPWPERPETDLLRQLSVPVHLICGELSIVAPPAFSRRMAACLEDPHALTLVPEAHHHVLLDQPLALVTALRTVLSPFCVVADNQS